MVQMGEPRWRGRQLAHGLYHEGTGDLDAITPLPAALRRRLQQTHGLTRLVEVGRRRAPDGSVKHLFELADGRRIESVAIPMERKRWTFCLSSQVGCRMACAFCATARMGRVRQLTAGEMVAQVLALRRLHPSSQQANLVFMGMGEPLDNIDELEQALRILSDPDGMKIGARHITISTSGLVDGIERLGRGESAVLINQSADQVCRRVLRAMDASERKSRRESIFASAANLAVSVPAFSLNISLNGRFWELIEDTIFNHKKRDNSR